MAASGCSSNASSPKRTANRSTTTTTVAVPSTEASTTTSTTGRPTTTTTTVDPNKSSVAGGCAPSQMAASVINQGVAAGSVVEIIGLTNSSPSSCTLYGYPGLQLIGSDGKPLPLTLNRVAQPGPTTVTVAPGATASFRFSYSDGTGYNPPSCAKASRVIVTPPNDYAGVSLDSQPAPCGPAGATPQASVTSVASGDGG